MSDGRLSTCKASTDADRLLPSEFTASALDLQSLADAPGDGTEECFRSGGHRRRPGGPQPTKVLPVAPELERAPPHLGPLPACLVRLR